jgi:hypothetical protein
MIRAITQAARLEMGMETETVMAMAMETAMEMATGTEKTNNRRVHSNSRVEYVSTRDFAFQNSNGSGQNDAQLEDNI